MILLPRDYHHFQTIAGNDTYCTVKSHVKRKASKLFKYHIKNSQFVSFEFNLIRIF